MPQVFISALNNCTLLDHPTHREWAEVNQLSGTERLCEGVVGRQDLLPPRLLSSAGPCGWSANQGVSESLLLYVGTEPLIWPISSRKDQV